ncbi:PROPROTEIN CONVERTASE SUBTILISIN/KEXIN [Salix koriyanagi]|uniref:PROPROTEIN CONVERTASE SUBTILISIN/KEXIN n=1 Tax=Salix koriyanagi TaxID=2511006 RepID=A0A9Q0Z5T8_9ROSI|nr:PROPROTEIN CONVERTASE SUBTILISIN/KEXIN [Salix koriyanagi]
MATRRNVVLHKLWICFITFLYFSTESLSQTDNYIVHMDLSVMPKLFADQHHWYLSTLASVSDVAGMSTASAATFTASSKLLYSYTHVVNGFSASLTPSELEALKKSPGYVSSIKDLPVKHDTTHSLEYLGLTPQSPVWKASNYGDGIIIGLVDTGVWPESESYSDHGMPEIPETWRGECEGGAQFNSSMCNKKLIGARFFNKGLIAKQPNVTISMNSTRDTEGHGTHTSSTAAGNYVEGASYFGYAKGTASGVAPRAHVAMYKALWDEGSYTTDIIAAIDQAISDGVDVLSISLGLDGVPLNEDPIALASFAAMEKNIFVSTSAGNEGPFRETLHNGIPWVLTVAAGTLDREFGAVLTLGNGISIAGSSFYLGSSSFSEVPIVFKDGCHIMSDLIKIGPKIVVCEGAFDSNDLSDQVENVSSANVTAGVFITNFTDTEGFIGNKFPVVIVSLRDGKTITDYIKNSNSPQASAEFRKTNLGIKPAPRVTSYSSRGPSASCPLVLKPDIMAPGSLILAAWPQNIAVDSNNSLPLFSNFNILSGTSMACPHAAGVAALLRKAHPDWSPAAIRSAMVTTADTMDNSMEPIKDIGFGNRINPASPLDMGAGQVNPNNALDPGLIYDVNSTDYVRLLCATNFTEKQIQVITGSSSTDCSNLSNDLNYPSFIAYFNEKNSSSNLTIVREFHRTVTNVGEGICSYTASVTPMSGLKVNVMPDKLEFKTKYEKLSYKLTIEGPALLDKTVTFGYLEWADSGGKHVVRSPIAATSLSPELS